MTDNAIPILDFINKFWVQITALVGAMAWLFETRFKVHNNSRRIEKLEQKDKETDSELKEIRKDISDKLEKIYTILIENK